MSSMMYHEPLTQLSIQACHMPQEGRVSLQQVSSIYIPWNMVNKRHRIFVVKHTSFSNTKSYLHQNITFLK